MVDVDLRCSDLRALPADEAASFVHMTADSEGYARSKLVGLRALDDFMCANGISLEALTEGDVEGHMRGMLRDRSVRTANMNLFHARSFLEWLFEEGYDVPTCDGVWYQRLGDDGSRWSKRLDDEMIARVLRATRRYPRDVAGMRDAIAVNLALRCGAPTAALAAMDVGDVELGGSGGSVTFGRGSSRRPHAIADDMAQLIGRYLELRGHPPDNDPLLVSTAHVNPNCRMTTDGIRLAARQRLANSGVPKGLNTLGTLRNTYTNLPAMSGLSLEGIEWLLMRRADAGAASGDDPLARATVAVGMVLDDERMGVG